MTDTLELCAIVARYVLWRGLECADGEIESWFTRLYEVFAEKRSRAESDRYEWECRNEARVA